MNLIVAVCGAFLFFLLITGCMLKIGRDSLCNSVIQAVPNITRWRTHARTHTHTHTQTHTMRPQAQAYTSQKQVRNETKKMTFETRRALLYFVFAWFLISSTFGFFWDFPTYAHLSPLKMLLFPWYMQADACHLFLCL